MAYVMSNYLSFNQGPQITLYKTVVGKFYSMFSLYLLQFAHNIVQNIWIGEFFTALL